MNEQEKLQHEAFKSLLKKIIQGNQNLTDFQKQLAMDKIDYASHQADWIIEMLRMGGYFR